MKFVIQLAVRFFLDLGGIFKKLAEMELLKILNIWKTFCLKPLSPKGRGENDKTKNVIDTSIYSNHWFRCPMQSKGTTKVGIHQIIKGKMKHFVIEHIPKRSTCIDECKYMIKETKNIVSENAKIIEFNTPKFNIAQIQTGLASAIRPKRET